MPQWFSMAPKTRLMATTPLSGYSEMDTSWWICDKRQVSNKMQLYGKISHIWVISGINAFRCLSSKDQHDWHVIGHASSKSSRIVKRA